MALDVNQLTIDYKSLSKLRAGQRSEIQQNPMLMEWLQNRLTPTQMALLFPSYYKQELPDVSGFKSLKPEGESWEDRAKRVGSGGATATPEVTPGLPTGGKPTGQGTPAAPITAQPSTPEEILQNEIQKTIGVKQPPANFKTTEGRMKAAYSAARKAGFSPQQAKIMMGEVGRENDFNMNLMFGSHAEPGGGGDARGRTNSGVFSWGHPSRRSAFVQFMTERGAMDASGNIEVSQEGLNAQFEFALQEMSTYNKASKEFLANPDISQEEGSRLLASYIGWDIQGRHINPTLHIQKRDNYIDQISRVQDEVEKELTEPATTLSDPNAVPSEHGGATVTPVQTVPPAEAVMPKELEELIGNNEVLQQNKDKLINAWNKNPQKTAEDIERYKKTGGQKLAKQTTDSGDKYMAPVEDGNQNAGRYNPVDPQLRTKISEAVGAVYGPGYKAVVYSGGEPTSGSKVSNSGRHDVKFDSEGNMIGGQAADVYVVNIETGQNVPRSEQIKLGQYWQAQKWGGTGLGMKDGGIHLDQVQRGEAAGQNLAQRVWAYGRDGGSQKYLTDAERQAFVQARSEGFDINSIRTVPVQVAQDSSKFIRENPEWNPMNNPGAVPAGNGIHTQDGRVLPEALRQNKGRTQEPAQKPEAPVTGESATPAPEKSSGWWEKTKEYAGKYYDTVKKQIIDPPGAAMDYALDYMMGPDNTAAEKPYAYGTSDEGIKTGGQYGPMRIGNGIVGETGQVETVHIESRSNPEKYAEKLRARNETPDMGNPMENKDNKPTGAQMQPKRQIDPAPHQDNRIPYGGPDQVNKWTKYLNATARQAHARHRMSESTGSGQFGYQGDVTRT